MFATHTTITKNVALPALLLLIQLPQNSILVIPVPGRIRREGKIALERLEEREDGYPGLLNQFQSPPL